MVMLTARVLNLAALAFTRERGCLPALLLLAAGAPPLRRCLLPSHCLGHSAANREAAAGTEIDSFASKLQKTSHAKPPRPALLRPHPALPWPPCSGHVSGAAAVRQLGGPAGRVPEKGHVRHLGGDPAGLGQHGCCRAWFGLVCFGLSGGLFWRVPLPLVVPPLFWA